MSEISTLLFTDVVESTQLNDAVGDAVMGVLWKAHDIAARELMAAWRGREVARADGFLVLFDTCANAVSFAMAYHHALRSLDARLKARVGVHTGAVALRVNTNIDRARGAPPFEVDGVALPIVARLMAAASGGQTLVTADAFQALGPTPLGVKCHGYWRLKGLRDPLELFEVGHASAAFEPPADSEKAYRVVRSADEWIPVRAIVNNLPAERDTFVGRGDALRAIKDLFDGPVRLATLLGIGGIGKTRLALRHAKSWLGDYPGGAWFCDLSTARGPDGILAAVAQALGVPLGKAEPIEQIGHAIAARGSCLVILDNFEQVSRHAEATLGVWMEVAAKARFLVTSREVLGISGEQTVVLAPLNPVEGAHLFEVRSASAVQGHVRSASDATAIGPLVKLLDGLPLAIELAAARTRVMSPAALLERMSERFTLLAARGGRVDRQVTLRATLDWSWDLLSPEERSALAQLSVFEGGFTLAAVEALVHVATHNSPIAALDLIQSLLDKSFVRQVGDYRLDLLQSVQEYASQHLRAEGRFADSGPAAALGAEVRHGRYYAGLTEVEVTAPGCLDLDNVIAACRRAASRGDCAMASQTVMLAWSALELRGPFRVGVELAELVLSIAGIPNALASGTQLIKGRALKSLGATDESRICFEATLQSMRLTGDRHGEAKALSYLGSLAANAGRVDEARQLLQQGLELARAMADTVLECELLNSLGVLDEYLGRTEAALATYERALTAARVSKNRRLEGCVLGNLGSVHYACGRTNDARLAYEVALVAAREIGSRQWEGNALCNLGLMHHLEGRNAEARDSLDGALRVAREMGHARLETIVLCNLGIVEEASSPALAQDHFEAALKIAVSLADRRSQGQILGFLGLLYCKVGRDGEGRVLLDNGRRHLEAISDDSSLALLLCKSAEAHRLLSDEAAAGGDLEEAIRVAERLGGNLPLELNSAIEHLRSPNAKTRRASSIRRGPVRHRVRDRAGQQPGPVFPRIGSPPRR